MSFDNSWIVKGGIVMIALIPCSIIALAIFLERLITLTRVRKETRLLQERVGQYLEVGDREKIREACDSSNTPLAVLLSTALQNSSLSKEEIEKKLEDEAKKEVPKLEKFLPALGTITSISPMLGFLGTVTGMIKSFNVLATQGTNPAALAGGIAEALITTAVGLFIAIPSLVAYNYLVQSVSEMVTGMEVFSTMTVEKLKDGNFSKGSSSTPASKVKTWGRI